MIRTKEVRKRLAVNAEQISRYRRAGLFSFEPIAVSHGGLWRDRVYPEAALTTLEILEWLRKRGFGLKAMRILFCTMVVGDETRDFITFDDKARIVIAPERLEEARRIIEAVVRSYPCGYELPPLGESLGGKG